MQARKAVLVTGASTGLGRRITEHLAGDGHFVYAGARKDSDLDALGAIKNVKALRLDVTRAADVTAAVDEVARIGRGLYGLVNNAGVATFGPIVNGNDQEFDLSMAVNVRGVYWVTKAFAPFIIGQKGRIVTIGSISGILADQNACAYSMSKHALEAFTDALAAEMQSSGVHVAIVEPGAFNSNLCTNLIKRIGADPRLPGLSEHEEPEKVAVAVALALFDLKPKRRYLVVQHEHEARRTIKKQIEQLVQLNDGQAYSYSREELIAMLDEAVASEQNTMNV